MKDDDTDDEEDADDDDDDCGDACENDERATMTI